MVDDPAFHYPPDVFEAVIAAIPVLVRGKRDVLTFFEACGVDRGYLASLVPWTGPEAAKSKYHIAREVVAHLNELGDAGPAARRRLLQRASEFENFSACWPDDQLKARGAVAQLASLINKKDSFTRLQQEQERTQAVHRESRRADMDRVAARRAAQEKVKTDLYQLFSESDANRRGIALEGVLNRLFQIHDILVREAFVVTGDTGEGTFEQIDGAVEIDGRLYLVEMKWWNKPLGRRDVAPHLVSVFNRGTAGGIFISNSGYHDSVFADYRDALTRATVILVELQEIVDLLEQGLPLLDVLRPKLQAATLDKNPLFRPLGRS